MATKLFIEESILEEILISSNLIGENLAVPKYNISYKELIKALIEEDGTKGASSKLGMSQSALETHISRHLKSILPTKAPSAKWSLTFLRLIDKSRCHKCGCIDTCENLLSGKNNICKVCSNNDTKIFKQNNPESVKASGERYRINNGEKVRLSYNNWAEKNKGYLRNKDAKRRLALYNATPFYGYNSDEEDKIIEMYANTPAGYEVDHIVPLQGKNVSGLHVLCNLQYLPKHENRKKSNKFPYEN